MFDVKPLRWSFVLSLPFFVVAIWLVFLVLGTVERNQRNAALRAQICHGSVEEAMLAVRRMARLSNPPLDLVAAAAVSPSGLVADEAQLAINNLLRRWQRQLKAGRNTNRVTDQLNRLAEALDERRDTFSIKDYPWLAKTATRIVRLANRTSPDGAPGLAAHCDSLLALGHTPIRTATRPVSLEAADLIPPAAVTAELVADAGSDQDLTAAVQQPAPPSVAVQPSSGLVGTGQAVAVTAVDASPAAPAPEGLFSPPPRAALQAIRATDNSEPHRNHAGDAIDTLAPSGSSSAWRGEWLRPLLGHVGIAPVLPPIAGSRQSADFRAPPAGRADLPQRDAAWVGPASSVHSRTLLERWLTADAAAAVSIERELAQRGFGTLSPELIRQLLTDVVDDRVQLVYDVIITPGLNAKPWLMLLADDASAEVRLAAVSVMATSSDPELIERAWQVALHDRDPRVSRLAERLRGRRAR